MRKLSPFVIRWKFHLCFVFKNYFEFLDFFNYFYCILLYSSFIFIVESFVVVLIDIDSLIFFVYFLLDGRMWCQWNNWRSREKQVFLIHLTSWNIINTFSNIFFVERILTFFFMSAKYCWKALKISKTCYLILYEMYRI